MALPNLRRLFVEARTEAEENEYSRNAVSYLCFDRGNLTNDIRRVLQSGAIHFICCCLQLSGTEDEWSEDSQVMTIFILHGRFLRYADQTHQH